jgi:carbon monoxide dehydrogenase subunit G
MYHVRVSTKINAPQERVFALLSDHERFLRGPGFECRLVTLGREDRNGVGAVREVKATGSVFTEEVTEFNPPRGYTYVVRTLIGPMGRPTPFTHERGWIELSREGDQTRVDWQSRFGMPIPLVGGLVARIVGPRIRSAFVQLLASAKTELERGPKGP